MNIENTNLPKHLGLFLIILHMFISLLSLSLASAISSPRSKASSRRVSTDPGGATTGGASYVSVSQ